MANVRGFATLLGRETKKFTKSTKQTIVAASSSRAYRPLPSPSIPRPPSYPRYPHQGSHEQQVVEDEGAGGPEMAAAPGRSLQVAQQAVGAGDPLDFQL